MSKTRYAPAMGILIKTGKTRYFPAGGPSVSIATDNVGSFNSTTTATITLTLKTIGDLVTLQIANPSGNVVNGVTTSGTGTTSTWAKAAALASGTNHSELWYATVTGLGAVTFTATLAGSSSGGLAVIEFTAGGAAFTLDQASNGTAATSSPYALPSLSAGGLYVAAIYATGSAGNIAVTTAGYNTYPTTPTPDGFIYGLGVTGTQSPQGTASGTVNASNPVLPPAATFTVA